MNKYEKPSRMIIELTDRCNFRCIHCFANKNDKELLLADWKSVIQKSIDDGISSISITGGEPLLYPNFFDIFNDINPKETKITLDSNGSLIDSKNIGLIKKYFKLVRISIYGYTEDDSNRITRNKKFTYLDILNSIKLLSTSGIKIQVNIPLFRENINHMKDILNDLKELNLYEIVFIPIIQIGEAKNMLDLPTSDEIEQLYNEYKVIKTKLRLFQWAEGKHFLVRADGNVYLHPFYNDSAGFYLGNILESSIDELWENVDNKFKEVNLELTPSLDDI